MRETSNIPLWLALTGVAVQFASSTLAVVGDSSALTVADDLGRFVEQAKGRPYVLLSVVQHVRITDVPAKSPTTRTADIRIVYTALCLKDITASEGVFTEQISGNDSAVTPWYGTSRETKSDMVQASGSYKVEMACAKGDVVTLETGATLAYQLPRPKDIASLGGFTVTKGDVDRDFWGYPAEPDFIYRLTIVVEANVPLKVLPGGAKRKNASGLISDGQAFLQTPERGAGNVALVGTWSMLTPTEQAALQWAFDRSAL